MFSFIEKRERKSRISKVRKHVKNNRLFNWLKYQLIKFFLIAFSVFFMVVYFSPSDAQSNQSTHSNQSPISSSTNYINQDSSTNASSCPVIFHRFVGGAYGLEVEREGLDPAYWLMIDSKKQVKELKKKDIQVLSYEQFIKKISPASVGVVSSTIYKAYGDIQKVYFFRGNSVDISKSERSTCLDNLAKQKAGLKKDT